MNEKNNSSQCYGPKAWQAYQAGNLSELENCALEEHLLTCEECLEIYLSILAGSLQDQTTPKLGVDFTNRLFEVIEQEKLPHKAVQSISLAGKKDKEVLSKKDKEVLSKKDKEVSSNKVNLLISYCAAASIAMFFWVGGYFGGLSDKLTNGVEYIHTSDAVETQVEPHRGLIQSGWTQKVIQEERPSFIQNWKLRKE